MFRYRQSSLSMDGSASGPPNWKKSTPATPTICSMHEGLNDCAWSGEDHGGAGFGGENRSGGESAKGMPRYAFAAGAVVG